jgi:hypothetical protein
MQIYLRNILSSDKRVYRLRDLLDTCKGSDLNLIFFKDIIFNSYRTKITKSAIHMVDTRYPILVTPNGDKYDIVDGHHRYLKMKLENNNACIAFVISNDNFAQIKDSWKDYPRVLVGCEGCEE